MKTIIGISRFALVLIVATAMNILAKAPGESAVQNKKQSASIHAPASVGRLETGQEAHSAPQKEGPLDRALTAKVRASLSGDSGSSATGPSARSEIQVSSFHGIVTLRGTVKSEAEKQALVDKVQNLGGVTIVKNELQVTTPPTLDQGSPAQSVIGTGSSPKTKE
jgi:osmotically-inducible protein OsmY